MIYSGAVLMHNCVMSPEQEDRGVEPETEEVIIDGKEVVRETPHELDGIGEPAAEEDDTGSD